MFHVMNRLNNMVGEFLKSFDVVRDKIGKELSCQKEKTVFKEERKEGEYDIAVLRKVNFKKERTNLCSKLYDIDTLNKKMAKFEISEDGESKSMEIDGKRVE